MAKAPKLRNAPGNWERVTNKQQKKLVRVYNTWSAGIRRKLNNAAKRGASIPDLIALLERNLEALEQDLVATVVEGVTKAVRLTSGQRFDNPEVARALSLQIQEDTDLVKTSLIPRIYESLLEQIALGKASDKKVLQASFLPMQSAAAAYAGTAWVAIFVIQQTLGKIKERELIAEGKPIEPVRWVLDPRAEHCVDSPGKHGCVGLAGVYKGGWSTLPTVPAGQVTCRGNCRCHLEVKQNGQWQREVFSD